MYNIHLTEDEVSTVCFVGGRYCWAEALLFYLELTGDEEEVPEHIAWVLKEEFEKDTEGGHSFFPMLAPDCKLYRKLEDFMDSIV